MYLCFYSCSTPTNKSSWILDQGLKFKAYLYLLMFQTSISSQDHEILPNTPSTYAGVPARDASKRGLGQFVQVWLEFQCGIVQVPKWTVKMCFPNTSNPTHPIASKTPQSKADSMSLPSWRLTWNIIMEAWKMIFLSKWVIYRFQPLIFQGVFDIISRNFHTKPDFNWCSASPRDPKRCCIWVEAPLQQNLQRSDSSLESLRDIISFDYTYLICTLCVYIYIYI